MAESGQTRIGTSGWHYPHWKGLFYPEGIPDGQMLDYYCRHFRTVELNNTFYRLPEATTFENWRQQTPPDFLFACKASRFITHMKKLTDPHRTLKNFLQRVELLQEKLGPILFQLPPRWHLNLERLQTFLQALPKDFRYAFEFRDASWFNPAVYEALSRHNAAFCIFDLGGGLAPRKLTADLVYLRLHGPGGAYQGSYAPATLKDWAKRFSDWTGKGRSVWCYFDNDEAGYAARNALELKKLTSGKGSGLSGCAPGA